MLQNLGIETGENITKSLANAHYLKADETTYRYKFEKGQIWVIIGQFEDLAKDMVLYHVSTTRAALVLDALIQDYSKPITCDGYSGYSKFEILQRCWAHMLRESKDVKRIHDKKYPGLAVLHDNLTALFHNAKHRQRKDNNAPIIDTEQIENNVQAIASRYRQYDIGDAFATKLENAIPHLFTFVNYPGMDPTNNESERMLRKPVIFRGIRYALAV